MTKLISGNMFETFGMRFFLSDFDTVTPSSLALFRNSFFHIFIFDYFGFAIKSSHKQFTASYGGSNGLSVLFRV